MAENFSYRLQASYTYKKFYASYLGRIQHSRNNVISDVRYMGDGLFLSQSVNARRRRSFQNELTLRISDIYGFGANLYLGLTHYQSAGEV